MTGITVSGVVLKTERRNGSFNNERGENIAYDFTIARILCDDEVVEVKFKHDRPDAQPPAKGATVAVVVELPRNTKVTATGYAPTLSEVGKRAG